MINTVGEHLTELLENHQRMVAFIEAAPDAMVVINQTGDLLLVNRQVEAIFGYQRKELLAQKVEILLPENIRQPHIAMRDAYFVNPEIREIGIAKEISGQRKNGEIFAIDVSLSPIKIGEENQVIAVIRDINERKETERKLVESEERLSLALKGGDLGFWDADFINDRIIVNSRYKEIFGYPLSEDIIITRHNWLERIHPEDLKAAQRVSKDSTKSHLSENEMEYRILALDGQQKWVVSKGTVVERNAASFPIRMVGTVMDITSRKEAEIVLKKTTEKAEAANKAKSDFLSNMSHEIRTPMNAILGFTELLDDQLEDPKLKSFVKTIQSAGNNLLALINDILDLSKIEAGKLQVKKSACNVHDLFSEIGHIFTLKIQQKNLDFSIHVEHIIPQSLMLDATRLRQVMLNLIGNAIKFTEQGFIKVKVCAKNENEIRSTIDLRISIEDTGIGIAENQLEQIFHKFGQSEGQNVAQFGGTGLGLSISKHLIEMMGGTISVKSTPEKGSVFNILFKNIDISSMSVETKPSEEINSVQYSSHPAHILIVDDVANNRALLLENLSKIPAFTVTKAMDGQQALTLNQQQEFDLILMDIRMPVMDGYQATRKIREFSNVPIIALTASVMKNEFNPLQKQDFDGYLRKPVLKKDLLAEISKFIGFDEQEIAESSKNTLVLNSNDYTHLAKAVVKLEKLIEHCAEVSQSNKIKAITEFADEVIKLANDCPVSSLEEYSEQLNNAIASFDIATIQSNLNEFPLFVKELQTLLNTREKH